VERKELGERRGVNEKYYFWHAWCPVCRDTRSQQNPTFYFVINFGPKIETGIDKINYR
jgi:hypothetical protein